MKPLIIALLLIPVHALAASKPCKPKSTELCTPDDAKKDRIMKFVKAGVAAKTAWKKAVLEFNATHGAEPGVEIDEVRWALINTIRDEEKKMNDNCNQAIELAQDYYHAGPTKKHGFLAQPRYGDGKADWLKNKGANWKPVFSNASMEVYRRWDTSDENNKNWRWRYFGAPNKKTEGGFTQVDGSVGILPATFDIAAETDNPGVLASAIHHEAVHFDELLVDGADTPEDGEVRAYGASLAVADIFELTGKMREVYQGQFDENARAIQASKDDPTKKLKSFYVAPEYEAFLKQEYEHEDARKKNLDAYYVQLKDTVKAAREERQQKWEREREAQIDQHLAFIKEVCRRACRTPLRPGDFSGLYSDESIAYSRVRSQHLAAHAGKQLSCGDQLYADVLARLAGEAGNELTTSLFNDLVNPMLQAKERREAEDAALVRTNQIAEMFGFGGLDDIDSDGRHVFKASPPVKLRVRYQDDLIAFLFLKRSCLDAQVAQPSAEALGILRKGIPEREFMARLSAAFKAPYDRYPPIEDHCLNYLISNPTWLTSAANLESLLADLRKQQRDLEGNRRKAEARNRANERDQKRIDDRNERIRERAEARRDHPNADFTPAIEAIRRAREHGLP